MILWATITAGFTLGAAGSLHCVGMCGPLSLALPTVHLSNTERWLSLLSYQAGRILTYSFFGLLLGLAGRRIFLAGYQQAFSIAMGILILVFALLYFLQKYSIRFSAGKIFYAALQKKIIYLMRYARGPAGFFLVGLANGFLPCGMVYMALVAALSFSQAGQAVLFMVFFGLGTLPAMMIVGLAGRMIRPQYRFLLRRATPIFITLIGVILILRGLNLGIPFISPVLPHAVANAVACHP
jgi:uncharacterized protein